MGGKGWHVEKRSKCSCLVIVEQGKDPATGKRRRATKTIRCSLCHKTRPGSCRTAELEGQQFYYEVIHGRGYTPPSRESLGDYLLEWLPERVALKRLSPKTASDYEYVIRKHILPRLGPIPLQNLAPGHIDKALADIATHSGSRTAQYTFAVLNIALRAAARAFKIKINPCLHAERPHYERQHYHAMNQKEVKDFLAAIQKHRLRVLFYTALATGASRSELLALRRRDLDLKEGVIYINQGLIYLNGYIPKEPKTEARIRPVDIDAGTVAILREHLEAHNSNIVFPNRAGGYLYPRHVTRAFKKVVATIGLPNLRFHDLRHTHATMLLNAGVPAAVVQARLGHAHASTTTNIYGHRWREAQRMAAETFAELLPMAKEWQKK